MGTSNVFIKDPNATLDYGFDWSQWLDNGETIFTYTINASPCGIVNLYNTSTITGSVVAWLTSGCVGTRYSIACRMTTSASRVDERTIKIDVKER